MECIKNFFAEICSGDFSRGFLYGAATVAGTLLVLWILNLIITLVCRKKRCSMLMLSTEGGNLEMSENAVLTIVKIIAAEFSELSIRKTRLYCVKNGYKITVQSSYTLSGIESITKLSTKFKARVHSGLIETLGFNKPLAIDLHLTAVKGKSVNHGSCSEETASKSDVSGN